MNQDMTDLPEGTDKIVKGAGVNAADMRSEPATTLPDPAGGTPPAVSAATSAADRIREQVRSGADKLAEQAGNTARGLVSQGIERSSEALGNVSRLVGDTAGGLDERLGTEYGDYARRAAEAIDRASTRLREKDPDELIDDARRLVEQSPAVALAGAAVVGFALVRLVKAGMDEASSGSRDRKSGSKKA